MLKSAKDVVASCNVGDVVDYATELHRQIGHLQGELEILKDALRRKGTELYQATGKRKIVLEGKLGEAQITLVQPQWKTRKGMDLLAMEPFLPREVFGQLFVKKVVAEMAPDFRKKLEKLPAEVRVSLDNLVEEVESTPRVNLK